MHNNFTTRPNHMVTWTEHASHSFGDQSDRAVICMIRAKLSSVASLIPHSQLLTRYDDDSLSYVHFPMLLPFLP